MDAPCANPDIIFELAGVTAASTLGVAYIGILFASSLYGITCCQTLNYFRSRRYCGDSKYLKSLVISLWLLDTLHQAMVFHVGYHYLIEGYGRPEVLFGIVWSLPTEWILTFVIGAIVQTFFVTRIWRFSRNLWMTGLSATCMIAAFGIGIVYPVKTYILPETLPAEERFRSLSLAGSGVALACDVIIALTIAFYLHNSRTGFRRSDGIISRLMILAIAAGGLTASFWMANLVALVVAPSKLYDLLFNPALSKLYTNSLLTMLNTRNFAAGVDTYDVSLNDFQMDSVPSAGSNVRTGPGADPYFLPFNNVAPRAGEKTGSVGWRT